MPVAESEDMSEPAHVLVNDQHISTGVGAGTGGAWWAAVYGVSESDATEVT